MRIFVFPRPAPADEARKTRRWDERRSERPVKGLAAATLILAMGRGGWYTCWAIFATHQVGLSPAEFGLGLTGAGLVGLAIGGPIGYLADRLGAREVLMALIFALGLATLGYAFVHGFWSFFLVSCVAVAAERTVPAIRIAVVSGLTEGGDRLRHLASLRVFQSSGTAVGSVGGVLVLAADTRPAYLVLLCLYGAASIVSALTVLTVPRVPSLADRVEKRSVLVVRDRPFLVLTAMCGVLALCWGMLSSGVPLWLTTYTRAPTWLVAVLMGLNTVAIVLFQKRVSRTSDTVEGSARLTILSAIPLALSCVLFALTYHGTGPLVVLLLVVAAGVHVVGELLFVAGSWGLAVGLTPHGAHGEYQGVFQSGAAVAIMFAPAIMATLVVGWGIAGWLVLAGLFLAGGLPAGHVSRLALRHRIRTEPAEATPQ